MRNLPIVLLTLVALFGFANAFSQHMILYANEEDGYVFKFPETWKRADEMEGKLSLVALAPEESEAEDGVRERLHVAIFQRDGKSQEAFFKNYQASHKEKNRSWKLNEEGEIGNNLVKALYFSCFYSDTKSGRTHSEYVYVFAIEDKAVILTCTTSFDEDGKYKEVFRKMASSFTFDTEPQE